MGHFITTFKAAALGLSLLGSAPVAAESLAGSYLAGRSAAIENNFEAAAQYFGTALARDPQNAELMEQTVLA
jgi:hypothetical protein